MAHSAVADLPARPTSVGPELPVRAPAEPPRQPPPKSYATERVAAGGNFLSDALLENHRLENSKKSKVLDLFVVLVLHVTLIGGPILAGLYFTDTLDLKQYTTMLLMAPPPPPPPPPPAMTAVKAVAPKRVFIDKGKLLAPTVIPRKIAEIKEAPLEPEALGGVPGGVPGGVSGGQIGGVIGGIIGGTATMVAPAPAPSRPLRVGGKIKPPRPISTPPPVYPIIARQARIQGVVLIDAVIDSDGTISEMKVLSGQPVLIPAALDAVRQWRYEPTYLNSQPIAVELIVTVSFVLGG
ncbi:MAG TPA: energy transducer TonB [Candidatus Angelobacter sp.]|nr:energy transducer TonB [Candidatus Angelobacter sp.]